MQYPKSMKIILVSIKRLLAFSSLLIKHLLIEAKQYLRIFYYQNKYISAPEVMLSNLRVSSHALDKSLYVANREGNRGYEKYKTCERLIKELDKTTLSGEPTLKWACEKIREYENLHGNCKCKKGESPQTLNSKERKRILDFIRTRRSVRHFTSEIIEQYKLEEIIDIARWAPNSCCRQSVFFYVSVEQEKIGKCMAITPGATCFSETVPCFISVCGDIRLYPLVDKGLLYIDGALAAENLLLAAHSYGIEGTILNWRQHMRVEEKSLKDVLKIAPYHSVIINIALGYPDFYPQTPVRRELSSIWKLSGDS